MNEMKIFQIFKLKEKNCFHMYEVTPPSKDCSINMGFTHSQ